MPFHGYGQGKDNGEGEEVEEGGWQAGRLAGKEGEDSMYMLCHIQLWYLMKLRIGSQINKVLQTYLVLSFDNPSYKGMV